MKDPVPPDDAERVAALHRLGVLDQPPAPDLDALTRLAAFVTGSPIGAVSLLDADRAVAVSASGVERQVVRRQDSMCQHTVAEGRTVSVPDARLDPGRRARRLGRRAAPRAARSPTAAGRGRCGPRVDLQLSGHTHGGQLVPFNLLVRLAQPFVAGLHRVRDTQVYVTRGTGTWGPRVRVGAPPEITLLTLRSRR